MMRIWPPLLLLVVAVGVTAWATDFVTLQGETTIYTVDCKDGRWQEQRCGGSLSAGPRYRFRALKVHREVLFWTVAVAEPSSHYVGCDIQDGRNWNCPTKDQPKRAITFAMEHGEPVVNGAEDAVPYHAVHKLRWLLLKAGLPAGSAAKGTGA